MAERETFRKQLLDIIHSMEEEGMVDHLFPLAYKMKESNGPFFFVQLIPTFCSDSQSTLRDMTTLLGEASVNFHELEELCFKLKGGTSCIGAHRMAVKCREFHKAAENKSKEGCIAALDAIKHEFLMLQGKFNSILELESKLI